VERRSADLDGVASFPLYGNHRDICRFAKADAEPLQKILFTIGEMLDGLEIEKISKRFPRPYQPGGKQSIPSLNFPIEVPRVHSFVGREDVIEQIEEALDLSKQPRPRKIAHLIGMGGVGKTQTALKIEKNYHDRFNNIFWVYTTSEQTARLSFNSLLRHARSQGILQGKGRIIRRPEQF
jgi:hypothetical protein